MFELLGSLRWRVFRLLFVVFFGLVITAIPRPNAQKPHFRGGHPLFRGRIDLNRASIAEVSAIPGISLRQAGAIVEARPLDICVPADLEEIRGVGPKTAERLFPYILRCDEK